MTETENDLAFAVPVIWQERLPRADFVTVLNLEQSAGFQETLRGASVHERDDGMADVIGMFRQGWRPIYLTGVQSRDGRNTTGILTFGGHRGQDTVPTVGFSVMYGRPEMQDVDLNELFTALEAQFALAGMRNRRAQRLIRHNWRPHLRPLAAIWDALSSTSSAVMFTGEAKHRGVMAELGMKPIPVVTRLVKEIADEAHHQRTFRLNLGSKLIAS